MLVRPTTPQVLLDCSAELREVLAEVADETLRARLAMVESVLRSAAVRSAHEIAWMHEEIPPMLAFAEQVLRAGPAPDDLVAAVAAGRPPGGLDLESVVQAYVAASDALSRALEVAVARGDEAHVAAGVALLERRRDREREVGGGWSSTAGR